MALRAGSVGLGREAGLGARRGWTRRRRPPHARGSLFPRPGPAAPGPVVVAASRARVWLSRLFPSRGWGGRRPRACARGFPAAAAAGGSRRGSPGRGDEGSRPGHPGGRRRRRLWTRAGPFPWIAPAAAGVAAALGEPGGRRARAGEEGRARACVRARGRGSPPSPVAPPPPRRVPVPPRRPARGLPPPGPPPGVRFRAAPRLGRRLAADLELVRTRGIRLFN